MANYNQIPGNIPMPPHGGIRRNEEDTAFESFHTSPYAQSAVTRPLDTNFQPSTDDNMLVSYSVQVAATLNLTNGQTGSVFLEISPDEQDWTEVARFVNGNDGTLVVGLQLTSTQAGTLTATVPKGYFARLRTAVTGTPTITYLSGQETVLYE